MNKFLTQFTLTFLLTLMGATSLMATNELAQAIIAQQEFTRKWQKAFSDRYPTQKVSTGDKSDSYSFDDETSWNPHDFSPVSNKPVTHAHTAAVPPTTQVSDVQKAKLNALRAGELVMTAAAPTHAPLQEISTAEARNNIATHIAAHNMQSNIKRSAPSVRSNLSELGKTLIKGRPNTAPKTLNNENRIADSDFDTDSEFDSDQSDSDCNIYNERAQFENIEKRSSEAVLFEQSKWLKQQKQKALAPQA
jgi:hypothetical protein